MRYDVCMLSYNTKDKTKKAIDSLIENSFYKIRIHVLDNNSSDGSQEMLKGYEKIGAIDTLILSEVNLGFGKGNNKIFNAIKEPENIILFINSDTEVSRDFDKRAVPFLLDNHSVGVVACSGDNIGALENPQRIEFINDREYITKKNIVHSLDSFYYAPIDRFSGFAFFIKTTLFKNIGGFDEDFKAYFEDDALSIEVKKRGKNIVVVYDAYVKHFMGASTANNPEIAEQLFQESKRIFLKKYPNEWTAR
ncbi:MAG TPA: glycosyltransferase [Bacteroidales bacterium]|nr:glycosyltransferase [Bacteroidales bacterium]